MRRNDFASLVDCLPPGVARSVGLNDGVGDPAITQGDDDRAIAIDGEPPANQPRNLAGDLWWERQQSRPRKVAADGNRRGHIRGWRRLDVGANQLRLLLRQAELRTLAGLLRGSIVADLTRGYELLLLHGNFKLLLETPYTPSGRGQFLLCHDNIEPQRPDIAERLEGQTTRRNRN